MSTLDATTEPKGLSINEGSSMLEIIRQIALDPKAEVAKFSELLSFQERLEAREAKAAFERDFALAIEEMPRVKKDAKYNPTRDGKAKDDIYFTSYEALDTAITPIEKKYGFTRSFKSRPSKEGGMKGIVQILVMRHKGGHVDESEMELPPDATGSGAMNGLKAMGSARSYGKRYLTKDYWNIITSDDKDDDGQAAGAITQDQADTILAMCAELGWKTDEQRAPFLTFMKVPKIADIQTYDYSKAIKGLAAKRAEMEKKAK